MLSHVSDCLNFASYASRLGVSNLRHQMATPITLPATLNTEPVACGHTAILRTRMSIRPCQFARSRCGYPIFSSDPSGMTRIRKFTATSLSEHIVPATITVPPTDVARDQDALAIVRYVKRKQWNRENAP
ncbi:hypothetical protein Rcae01_04714 [Novipirellula caenicola]|uniref:Uncharacterized protein n=1 Tax=Novipirellula caenicola TaxID=1536901 RepID=A0ABP9VXA0_9BACT